MAAKGNIVLNKGIPAIKDAFIIIVRTEWNTSIVDKLEEGAIKILKEQGAKYKTITVPGAFEIGFAINAFEKSASRYEVDAYIALGTVIRGGTPHFDYICQSVTQALTKLNLELKVPVVYGILTVEDEEQALERVGGEHGHKGEEAAITALKMIALSKEFDDYEGF